MPTVYLHTQTQAAFKPDMDRERGGGVCHAGRSTTVMVGGGIIKSGEIAGN